MKILIAGGGYGGLKTALTLQKRNPNAQITLISKHDYHYQTTLLHKIAVGTLFSSGQSSITLSLMKETLGRRGR